MHGVDLDEFTTLISLKYLLQICFHCSPKFKSILYKNHCYGNGGYHFECQNLFSTIISLVLSLYYETNVISCIRRDFIQIQGIYLNPFAFFQKGPFLEKAIFGQKSKVNPFAFFQKRAFFGISHFWAKK